MKIVIVGAGPGDPELITLRGKRIIEEAKVVIYAGSLVPAVLIDNRRSDALVMDSSSMTLDEVCAVYDQYRDEEGIIARVHTGDPSIYGAIQEQIDWCFKEGLDVEVVPGVSSFQAAAAVLKQELTLPELTQTVILSRAAGRTPVPEAENIPALAGIGASLVLFLSIGNASRVRDDLLSSYTADTPVALVYRVGWPDQRILMSTVREFPEKAEEAGITRQTLIIVSPVLGRKEYAKSKLYDPLFSHGWRDSRSVE